MVTTTIDDPDEIRIGVPVDGRGRVVVGREYEGKEVNVAVEVVGDD